MSSINTGERSFLSSLLSTSYSLPLRIYRHLSSPVTTTTRPSTTPTRSTFTAPSPLTYLTSSYLLISLSLAFLLHRIHHLVPPSNPLNQQQRNRVQSTYVQWGIRLPGLIAMAKSIIELSISLLSTRASDMLLLNSWTRSALEAMSFMSTFLGKGELGRYLSQTSSSTSTSSQLIISHPSLLFSTFTSISLSILLETLVRSLSSDSPQLHSFNLLSFSFLLHVQSQPSSSSSSSTSLPSRPNENTQLYIYLLLTLLELSTLQLSYLIPFSPFRSHSPSSSPSRQSTKHHRFKITLVYSLISQFFALKSFYQIYSIISSSSNSNSNSIIQDEQEGGGGGGNGNRLGDSFIWFNKLPELFFQLIVVTSISLKSFANFIRGDPLTRESLLGPFMVDWSPSEDYTIVLIKYTTLLLRSTRISTLSYELSPLTLLPNSITSSLSNPSSSSDTSTTTTTIEEQGGLKVRLEKNGDLLLIEELEQSSSTSNSSLRRRKGSESITEAVEYGYSTEIRQVLVEPSRANRVSESQEEEVWDGTWGEGFGGEWGTNTSLGEMGDGQGEGGELGMRFIQGGNERRNWILRFVGVLVRILIFVVWVLVTTSRRILLKGLRKLGLRSDHGIIEDTWGIKERLEEEDGVESEEEDEEYTPSSQEEEEESDSSEEETDDGEEDETLSRLRVARQLRFSQPQEDQDQESSRVQVQEEEENPLLLISDLSQDSTPSDLAPYLIAHHLSDPSSSSHQPLTRTRYNSLLSLQSTSTSQETDSIDRNSLSLLSSAITSHQSDLLSTPTENGRKRKGIPLTELEREKKRQEYRESLSSFCCVCTVEPRTIILWPCRCLCLCESCREALAERTLSTSAGGSGMGNVGDGGNLCPTCRTGIAGYSRIYIP